MTLVRKIRKDIGERRSEALDEVKRFLPLQKPALDIYVVEPFDGVNNRLLNPEMKKHGLQVARKVSLTRSGKKNTSLLSFQEKINSWEMIEGSKSVTSICYSWFCAKKTERKRLRYEEQYRLLLRHKHSLFEKSLTYFRVRPCSTFTFSVSPFARCLSGSTTYSSWSTRTSGIGNPGRHSITHAHQSDVSRSKYVRFHPTNAWASRQYGRTYVSPPADGRSYW